MQNHNSNIELPSNSQPSSSSHHNYLPQEDEEFNTEPQRQQQQPQRPQNSGLEGKLEACIKKICNINLDKAAKRASLLITFFLLLDLIPVIYTAIRGDTYDTQDIQGALGFISANLMSDPIMDIQIIGKESSCPSGFEALKFGVWHGTVAGCLCDNGVLSQTSCDKVDFPKCETIPAALPLEINERDGLIWCGKRAVLGADYLKQTECPSGYKECYNGGCFREECPITKVEITNQLKGEHLLLSRTQGELPLINIQMTPNDIPCFNQNLYAKPTKKKPAYKLQALNESGCDKYGFDSHFSKQLDSQSILDSYTQNNFRYSTMSLPDYEKYATNAMSITSWRVRMMTEKNDHCLNFDQKLVEKSLRAFNRSFQTNNSFIASIAYHFASVVIIIFCCCQRERDFLEALKVLVSAAVFAFLLSGYLPVITWGLGRLDDVQTLKMMVKDFDQYHSLGCFREGQGGMVISDYLEILRIGELNFSMGFGLVISNGLALLICGWFLVTRKMSSQRDLNPSDFATI